MWFYEIAFKCNIFSKALQKRIFTGDPCFLGFLGSQKLPSTIWLSHTNTNLSFYFRPACITECPWNCQTPQALFQKHHRETIKKVKRSESQEHQVPCQPFQIWKKQAGQILPLHSQWKTKNQRQPENCEALTALGHTVQLPLKPAGPQEKTLLRCCSDSWSFLLL